MPHLDGFAVLDQIRQFAPVEALPVLVLTADTTPAASERALRCGAQDFVIKPFSNAEVLVRIATLCSELGSCIQHCAVRSCVNARRLPRSAD